MRTIKGEGSYTRKATGEEIIYQYDYKVLEDISDVSEVELLKLANRMLKQDGNNPAREKAKSLNGDSSVKPLTPEQKEANKQARKADGADLKMIREEAKRQGISVIDLLALISK